MNLFIFFEILKLTNNQNNPKDYFKSSLIDVINLA